MYYFSVPSDFTIKTLKEINKLNNENSKFNVSEVYGQITDGEITSSGRMASMLPQITFEYLANYLKYCKKYNINFNYVLNPSCMGNKEFYRMHQKKIREFILKLYDIGIDSFTVALPSIMELILSLSLDIKIKASAICEINTPSKALFYKKLGVNRIVTDPDVTRKFNVIDNICSVFGTNVEIIVNNVCLRNCPYKNFHYNHEAHCNIDCKQDVKNYYFHRCSIQKSASVENSLKLNWIRPEDLNYYYRSGINYFKIQGRHNTDGSKLIQALQYYFNEDYDGDLMELITLFSSYNAFQLKVDNKKLDGYVEQFYKHQNFCNDICEKCNYCLSYAKKSMDMEKSSEINNKSGSFYKSYDNYLQ